MESVEYSRVKREFVCQIRTEFESIGVLSKSDGGTPILNARVDFPINPLNWLAAQNFYPKIYWSGREDDTEYFCAGAADLIHSDTPCSTSEVMKEVQNRFPNTAGIRYFGYMRFNTALEKSGKEWKDYGVYSFCLPKFTIIKCGNRSVLTYCTVLKEVTADEVISQFEQEFDLLNINLSDFRPHEKARVSSHTLEDQETWNKSVKLALNMIAENSLKKVILSEKLDVTYPEKIEPLSIIPYFQKMKSPAYFFCFQPMENTAFIGSSPECLYRRDGNRIYSEALAGTGQRGADEEEDRLLREALLNDTKTRHEHELVFQHIEKVLLDVCDGIKKDQDCRILSLLKIQHLLRKISGILKPGFKDDNLLSMLHPTPAVAGVPVKKSMKVISTLEQFDRGLYCGPVGWISKDCSEFAVGIRCGLIRDKVLTLYCGAGIVAGSVPEKEWEEVNNKFGNFIEVIEQNR